MATVSAVGGSRSRAPQVGRVAGAAVLAVVVASVVNAALALIGTAALSVPDDFKGFQPVAYVSLTFFGIAGAAVAWSLIAARAAEPVELLRRLALIIVPVTMLADLALLLSGQSPAGVALLVVMHVVVGLTAYFSLTRLAPARPVNARL
ncbi:hypothetical protein E1263_40840 [Kribbella antibiotica]|uniref:Uncharacterized protein n=1 Tax=Kribbella antibiotica TaxID=190195 RepID=A0A4R4YHU8_9ACTN|nr:DUF6069 family protein [Kribbella antibiotica]TDD44393.1 hypothetical protein E1263_40840 [Kribbella antibiotica]